MRWVEPTDYHITLRFIGNVSPSSANDIVEALSSKTWSAPHVTIEELRVFGGTKPRSVYAGVKETPELMTLAQSQERLFQRLGLAADPRRFTPHVTIARCRGVAPTKLARFLSERSNPILMPTFIPSRFAIYSAQEPSGGGPYRIEETWPLKPPVAASDIANL